MSAFYTCTAALLLSSFVVTGCSPPRIVSPATTLGLASPGGHTSPLPPLASLTLGEIPGGTDQTPTINFILGTSTPPTASVEARIVLHDQSLLQDWAAVDSGAFFDGLALSTFKKYRIEARIRHGDQTSSIVTSEFWIPASDNCRGERLSASPFANSGSGGDGLSETTAFEICTPEQLNNIGPNTAYYDLHFKQKADLDLAELTEAFNMIGGDGIDPFEGTYDGESRTIKNLTLNLPTTNRVGMFRYAGVEGSDMTIQNLNLSDVAIIGADYVGALIGDAREAGTLSSIHVSGAVQGGSYLGGIVGNRTAQFLPSYFTITDSTNAATISGTGQRIGGIAGYGLIDVSIANCSNTGNISGASYVGGLMGYTASTVAITTSTSSGTVTATSNAGGGLVGYLFSLSSSIIRSSATGAVTCGGDYCGGLAGQARGNIHDSYATSDVSGNNDVGGLVGYSSDGKIFRSYATGVITGLDNVGGISGRINTGGDAPANTFSLSTVIGASGTNRISSFIGYNVPSATVTNSFYSSASSCENSLGSCHTLWGTPIDTSTQPDYFFLDTNAPLSSWDFSNVWQTQPNALPVHR